MKALSEGGPCNSKYSEFFIHVQKPPFQENVVTCRAVAITTKAFTRSPERFNSRMHS